MDALETNRYGTEYRFTKRGRQTGVTVMAGDLEVWIHEVPAGVHVIISSEDEVLADTYIENYVVL